MDFSGFFLINENVIVYVKELSSFRKIKFSNPNIFTT